MNILDQLNSGSLHAKASNSRPDCVDAVGNIHHSAARAYFVNWLMDAKTRNGDDVAMWNNAQRAEYKTRFVA